MNNKQRTARSADSVIRMVFALILILAAYGCGSGSGSESKSLPVRNPAGVIVEPDQTLYTEATRTFDVYRSTNATRAIIFLHGIGRTKQEAASQFGIVDSVDGTVNKEVLIANRALAVFPQGQAPEGAPEAFTWSNYVTDSGKDDMAFISTLVDYIKTRYGISRGVYIVGHSTGGMMANRIWCEEPELFDGYVAIAGPPSDHFLLCSPKDPEGAALVQPYLGIVRAKDPVLGVPIDNWSAVTWNVAKVTVQSPAVYVPGAFPEDEPKVIGERYFLKTRVEKRCEEEVQDDDAGITEDSITTWSFCEDSIRLVRDDSDEDLDALQNAVWRFLSPS